MGCKYIRSALALQGKVAFVLVGTGRHTFTAEPNNHSRVHLNFGQDPHFRGTKQFEQ